MPIIYKVELIDKREFAVVALNKRFKIFVVYIATSSATLIMQIYLSCLIQVRLLFANKAPTKVLPKYLNYADNFSFDLTLELSKKTNMNKYTIELVKSK